jgi:putative MATE family efflux protein
MAKVTYKDILKLSLPIMIGSAVQNLITLTDTFFLGRVPGKEVEYLAAIGLAGVFYLLITTIGYSFTKAGQIMVARRLGAESNEEIGIITHAMVTFSLLLALIMFLLMKFGGKAFFGMFISDPDVLRSSIEYLDYRSYGIFFSYLGVVALSLYTGLSRTTVIIYNALIMGLANVFFNYGLIFGNLGMPKLGIGGAALASTLSEAIAFIIFLIYMIFDKKIRVYNIFKYPKINVEVITAQIKLSIPMILQTFASLGSWFIFFALIEQMGKNELAVSNIIRTFYMLFMIPAWGFSSGINTIVSNLIGKKQLRQVIPAINKTAFLCFLVTMIFSFSLVLFPDTMLHWVTNNESVFPAAKKLIWVLNVILALYSFSIIYFNGLVGTGATKTALYIQVSCVIIYMIYVYIVVGLLQCRLEIAWMAEAVYMISCLTVCIIYLKSNRWLKIKI